MRSRWEMAENHYVSLRELGDIDEENTVLYNNFIILK